MVGSNFIKANVYCKEQGILAGVPFVDAICEELGIKKPNWLFQEGSYLLNASPTNRTIVCNVIGPAKKVLMAERVILNVLCRASGVATESHRIRSALAWNGWSGQVVGTRKTTPGFRMVEKYGLLVGGAGTHRYDMSSMVMLKDNHVKLSGPNQTMGELIAKVSFDEAATQFTECSVSYPSWITFRRKSTLAFSSRLKLSARLWMMP